MAEHLVPTWSRAQLGARDFRTLATLVRDSSGIALTDNKRSMLESRLRRRLQAYDLDRFEDYVSLLADPEQLAAELQPLIDAVTTNHSAFFREPAHFDYLIEHGLADLLAGCEGRPLRAWSAACSTGEEPYTLAMVLARHLPALGRPGFEIVGTDISMEVLRTAYRAIYSEAAVDAVPEADRRQYVLRSRDPESGLVRVVPELRKQVRFGRINLTEPPFQVGPPFDLVLCRNVLIYFDPPVQRKVIAALCAHVRPGGLLILGHADTIGDSSLPLRLVRANIHERLEGP